MAASRDLADFVVVLLHAGTEYATTPDATQVRIAVAAGEAGATAVIGSHSHTIQPVTWAGPGTPFIAWSLGNFVFDLDAVDLANTQEPRLSLVLKLTLTEGVGVSGWEAVPVVLDSDTDRPRPATAAEAASLADHLADTGERLGESASCD